MKKSSTEDAILRLSLLGWSAEMIAGELSISIGYVRSNLTVLRKRGLIKAAQGLMAGYTIRKFTKEERTRFGGFEDFRTALTMADFNWLVKNTPEGMSSMEFLTSLVTDARMGEADAD